MQQSTPYFTFGIDVCKAHLDIAQYGHRALRQIENSEASINAWLDEMTQTIEIAIEPTSDFHFKLQRLAHLCGHIVYRVNPKALSHYRTAIGERNKDDPRLLARYLAHERRAMAPATIDDPRAEQLWRWMKRLECGRI